MSGENDSAKRQPTNKNAHRKRHAEARRRGAARRATGRPACSMRWRRASHTALVAVPTPSPRVTQLRLSTHAARRRIETQQRRR